MEHLAAGLRTGRTGAQPAPHNAWCVRWAASEEAPVRLFCLPHTGGGAALYRAWAQRLAPAVDVVAIRLPGRENRFRETPHRRLDTLVDALANAVEPLLDRPHAWFGHSMGALIAHELSHTLRERGLREPGRLLVSGRRAPHLPSRQPRVHDAPTPDLVAHLRELNGTPAAVLDSPAALAALLPMVRADFAVSETYQWRARRPLDCPVSVLGGRDDALTTPAELAGWRESTAGTCEIRMFDGGHFYLHEEAHEQVLAALAAELPLLGPVFAGRRP
ncbi:thioesterase [Streptomyces spiroverticillatus]|uniref:Thioesterase n=1 Tax=Streptomyces finlayi TaxID=67296 RepID=A0A918X940_9ACTN|nr:thioesterase domain-containing protein [Streptomyces finlayi]GHA44289.1 thioesterase [Streptomyces spiroverticillatus]GHD17751.1 thioesterase [Streptomyces finlayi]